MRNQEGLGHPVFRDRHTPTQLGNPMVWDPFTSEINCNDTMFLFQPTVTLLRGITKALLPLVDPAMFHVISQLPKLVRDEPILILNSPCRQGYGIANLST